MYDFNFLFYKISSVSSENLKQIWYKNKMHNGLWKQYKRKHKISILLCLLYVEMIILDLLDTYITKISMFLFTFKM